MKKGSLLKIVGLVLAVFLLFAVGAVAALYIMFPQQKIIALIVPQVEKAIGRHVAVEKAGITLYPSLGVSISGLQVSNTQRQGFSIRPFIKVERFRAGISVSSIFKGYPEIAEIIIKRPELRIEVDKTGAFNFSDLAMLKKDVPAQKPQSAPAVIPALPVPVTLKKLVVENGTIVYDDQKAGNQIIIESVNQQAAVSIDKQLKNIVTTGSLVLGEVSVKTRDIKKPLANLSITVSHDIGADLIAGSVNVRQVRMSLQKFFVTLKGSVQSVFTPAPVLDLAVVSDPVTVGDILKEVPPALVPLVTKLTGSGTAEMGLTVKGALAAGKPLPVQGTLALKDIMVKYADLSQSINRLNAAISFTDNSLTVNSMTMRFGTNPIDVRAVVTDFKKPFVDASLHADIKISEVKDIIKLPQGASLDGQLAADIKARGEADPADPSKLDLTGKVDLKKLVVVWSPLIKPAEINGAFTLSSKAVGQNIAVRVGQSSLTMAATVSNYLSLVLPDRRGKRKLPRTFIDFKMTSPFMNIDEILKPPEPSKGGGMAGADVPLLAPLPSADAKGVITADKIIYKGFPTSNMVTRVTITNNIATVDFTTGFSGGTIGNNLRADLNDVKNITFTNNLTVKSVELNDLMGRFGSIIKPVTALNRELSLINKSLFGRISLQSSLQGNGGTMGQIMKNVAGNIGVQMANGKIVNAPAARVASSSFASLLKTDKLGSLDVINFRDLASKVRLSNGRALFDDLKIASDIGDWQAKGSVGFDALMDMAVSTKLSKEISSRILAVEGKAKGLAKNALQGTQFAAVAGILDNMSVIPRDNDGRVTLKFGLGGLVASPKISSIAFAQSTAGGTSAAPQQPQPQTPVKQQVQQQAQQQVQQKVEQVKQNIEDQLKQKTQDKLKRLFNK